MKKLAFLFLFLFPVLVFAQATVPQGGTGLTSVPVGGFLVGNTSLRLAASSSPTVGSIYATNTSATSSLPRLRVSGAVDLLGEYFTNFTNYVRSLFSAGSGVSISSGSVSCNTADGSTFGCLTAANFNTFNGKQNALTLGNLTANSPLSFAGARQVIGGDATLSLGTVPIASGGTNSTAQISKTLLWFDGTSITATGTPQLTIGNLLATSTATSTFTGGISTNLLRVLSTTASSTFSNGINLTAGCFSINNVCLASSVTSGTVTSIATNNGLTGGTITNSGTIGLDTSALVSNSVVMWDGSKLAATGTPQITVGNVLATSTATSTYTGGIQTNLIRVTSTTASSTFSNGINITSGCFANNNTCVKSYDFTYPTITYATSTAWTGTTTIPLGAATVAETWASVQCFTDTGTLNVSFLSGTNRSSTFNASTTLGTVILTVNNTFPAGTKRYIDIGTPATSPTKISCTIKKSYD